MPCSTMQLFGDAENGNFHEYRWIMQDRIAAIKLTPGPDQGYIALDGEVTTLTTRAALSGRRNSS